MVAAHNAEAVLIGEVQQKTNLGFTSYSVNLTSWDSDISSKYICTPANGSTDFFDL